MFTIPQVFAQEKTGTIELFLKNENGDRVSPFDISVKVFKNLETKSFLEIHQIDTNPLQIPSLQLGQRYKIEVYVNNMYADTG